MGIKNFIFFYVLLFSVNAFGYTSENDFQDFTSRNFIKFNAGFENGTQGWTKSGPSITISSVSGQGGYATWDATASGQYIQSPAITIGGTHPNYNSLGSGKNLVAVVDFYNPSATLSASLSMEVVDLTNAITLASVTLPTLTTSGWQKSFLNYVDTNNGTEKYIRIKANADEPPIYVDNFGVYEANMVNISNVSSAQLVASGYFDTTAACAAWTRSTTTLGSVASDADCPGPTVETNPGPGVLQTTDVDLPKFTINNLPPGAYEVCFSATFTPGGGGWSFFAINDGTTTFGHGGSGTGATNYPKPLYLCGAVNYTNAGNRTFELYAANSGSSVTVQNDANLKRLYFTVKRFPTQQEQAYKASTIAQSWSGYHDNTCSWARTNTAYGDPTADASCALTERTNRNFGTVTTNGSALPGIIFAAPIPGKYQVMASMKISSGTAAAVADFQLMKDTVTLASSQQVIGDANTVEFVQLSGLVDINSPGTITVTVQDKISSGTITIAANGTTNSSAIEWSIVKIDQVMPAPLIKNSVVNPSSGVSNTCSAYVTNSGTAAVDRSDGNCLSFSSDNGNGDSTFTFATGTFSGTPNCICTTYTGGQICAIDPTTALSSTTVRVQTVTDAGAGSDQPFFLMCIGPK